MARKRYTDFRQIAADKKKNSKKLTATKSRDGKVAVKIDSKTTIFVKPEDVDKARERYKDTHKEFMKPKFKK